MDSELPGVSGFGCGSSTTGSGAVRSDLVLHFSFRSDVKKKCSNHWVHSKEGFILFFGQNGGIPVPTSGSELDEGAKIARRHIAISGKTSGRKQVSIK